MMKEQSLMILLALAIIHTECLETVTDRPIKNTENACTKQKEINVTFTEPETRYVDFIETEPCGFLGLDTCTVHKQREDVQYIEKFKIKVVDYIDCCDGFIYVPSTMSCIPNCDPPCDQSGGKCTKPFKCECYPGYGGQRCEKNCDFRGKLRFGNNCDKECDCENAQYCNPINGACQCDAGWRGERCDRPCPDGAFGLACQKECRCINGGLCDHVTGNCTCKLGFGGKFCEKVCEADSNTIGCYSACQVCSTNGTDRCSDNAECICKPGYKGLFCDEKCESGMFGVNCTHNCECYNGQGCDGVTGVCQCYGYTDLKCGKRCPFDKYGYQCSKTCQCSNGGRCKPNSPQCDCPQGYTGYNCSERVCPHDRYGHQCEYGCSCNMSNTVECHALTGKCQCKPGFDGVTCDRPCSLLKYGTNCTSICECHKNNTIYCDPVSGSCFCEAGFTGARCDEKCPRGKFGQNCALTCACDDCDRMTGQCNKSSCVGMTGPDCTLPCTEGRWGVNCGQKCATDCLNRGKCDPVDGTCVCAPGYIGAQCEHLCPQGTFGTDCSNVCSCNSTQVCDPFNGVCSCPPGQYGVTQCNARCTAGYYGENCSKKCAKCSSVDIVFNCHARTGDCLCHSGYLPDACTETCPVGMYGYGCEKSCGQNCTNVDGYYCHHTYGCCADDEERCKVDPMTFAITNVQESSSAWLWLLMLLAVGLTASVLIAIYFRKKYKDERRGEYPTVSYHTAAPVTGDFDRTQGDNPMFNITDVRQSKMPNATNDVIFRNNKKQVDMPDDISVLYESAENLGKTGAQSERHENLYTEHGPGKISPLQMSPSQSSDLDEWEKFDNSSENPYLAPSTISRATHNNYAPMSDFSKAPTRIM